MVVMTKPTAGHSILSITLLQRRKTDKRERTQRAAARTEGYPETRKLSETGLEKVKGETEE